MTAMALLLWAPVTVSVPLAAPSPRADQLIEPPSAQRTNDRQPGLRGCRYPATMESDLRRSGKYPARVRDGILGSCGGGGARIAALSPADEEVSMTDLDQAAPPNTPHDPHTLDL